MMDGVLTWRHDDSVDRCLKHPVRLRMVHDVVCKVPAVIDRMVLPTITDTRMHARCNTPHCILQRTCS